VEKDAFWAEAMSNSENIKPVALAIGISQSSN